MRDFASQRIGEIIARDRARRVAARRGGVVHGSTQRSCRDRLRLRCALSAVLCASLAVASLAATDEQPRTEVERAWSAREVVAHVATTPLGKIGKIEFSHVDVTTAGHTVSGVRIVATFGTPVGTPVPIGYIDADELPVVRAGLVQVMAPAAENETILVRTRDGITFEHIGASWYLIVDRQSIALQRADFEQIQRMLSL